MGRWGVPPLSIALIRCTRQKSPEFLHVFILHSPTHFQFANFPHSISVAILVFGVYSSGMTNGQRRRALANMKPTSAVIYLRVSTSKQAISGIGMEAQMARCQEHCAYLGVPVIAIHRDEAISGKEGIERRPGLLATIATVKANPGTIVVVYSLSRLGRSQRLIWTLLDDRGEYALPLASATEPFETATPMGRAMLGMLSVWAQLEADLVSERTIAALAAVAARGTRLGAPSMSMLAPETVHKVAEMYATGRYSHRSLASALNAQNVPTAKPGHKWHPKTVRSAIISASASALCSRHG